MTSVLVVRSDPGFSSILRDAGVRVSEMELVSTRPVEDLSGVRRRISSLASFDGLIFTSAAAAQIFVEEAKAAANRFDGFAYCLGERSTAILLEAGLRVRSVPGANTADEMIDGFGIDEFQGKRLLFLRGSRTTGAVSRLAATATLEEEIVYETFDVRPDPQILSDTVTGLKEGRIDWICFFSPSAVERFTELFDAAKNAKVAAIGKTTASRAAELGFYVGFVSARAVSREMAAGLLEEIRKV